MTSIPSLRDLVKAGAHLGHSKSRIFPKAKQFTYGIKDNVYVIDLEKTQEYLAKACDFLRDSARAQKTILFVATKQQAQEAVRKLGEETGMPYVDNRWLGGTITNFETVSKNIKKLEKMEELVKSDIFEGYSKKERGRITKKLEKMRRIFNGVKNVTKIPDVLVVVDTTHEDVAVKEAITARVPIVGFVDTNADPSIIDYPIPVNDDSKKAIELILAVLSEAIQDGLKTKKVEQKEE